MEHARFQAVNPIGRGERIPASLCAKCLRGSHHRRDSKSG